MVCLLWGSICHVSQLEVGVMPFWLPMSDQWGGIHNFAKDLNAICVTPVVLNGGDAAEAWHPYLEGTLILKGL